MPNGSGGFVWCPYSVTQISTFLRLNHVFRLAWRRGSDFNETFGHFTGWDGGKFGVDGYGWCDQASNLRRGLAFATSSANLPGECIGRIPVGLSLPRAEVSPMATFALRFPALIPVYPAAASFA